MGGRRGRGRGDGGDGGRGNRAVQRVAESRLGEEAVAAAVVALVAAGGVPSEPGRIDENWRELARIGEVSGRGATTMAGRTGIE